MVNREELHGSAILVLFILCHFVYLSCLGANDCSQWALKTSRLCFMSQEFLVVPYSAIVVVVVYECCYVCLFQKK